MKKLKNSIITVLLIAALCVNIVMVPASAVEDEDQVGTQVTTLYKTNNYAT